jgi:hypothetical protein
MGVPEPLDTGKAVPSFMSPGQAKRYGFTQQVYEREMRVSEIKLAPAWSILFGAIPPLRFPIGTSFPIPPRTQVAP